MDYRSITLSPMYDIKRTNDHKYFVGGDPKASVTQIIHSQLGIEYYHDTDFYKERGSEVDRCIGLFLDGNLEWRSMDSRIEPYMDQFAKFLQITNFRVLAHNRYIYNSYLGYAGEFDLLGTWGHNPEELILIDVKTGSKMPHYKLQTAMYACALRYTFVEFESLEFHEIKRFSLYLDTKKYKLDQHINTGSDYAYAQAIALAHTAKGIYK